MTYREKLQKEHPEKVAPYFIGGCKDCPFTYGYGPETRRRCGNELSEEKCKQCWDKVIPGTEDKQYENLSRDELITIVKLLEGQIKIKDAVIENYKSSCTDKNKKIEELEQKIQKLEGACSAKNAEIVRLEKDVADLKKRNDQLTSELASRIVGINQLKDKIDGLNVECKNLHYECKTRDKTIEGLEYALRKSEATCNAYKLQATQKTGCTCCCKADVIAEKDKEIKSLKDSLEFERHHKDYWYSECHNLSAKVHVLENALNDLNRDLEQEKKEHAKHHGFFARFN